MPEQCIAEKFEVERVDFEVISWLSEEREDSLNGQRTSSPNNEYRFIANIPP